MASRSLIVLVLLVAVAIVLTSASRAAPSAKGASAVVAPPNEAARGLQEQVDLRGALGAGSGGKADVSLLQSGSSMERWAWPSWVPWAPESNEATASEGVNRTSSAATLAEGAAEKASSGQSSSEEGEVEQKGTAFSVTLDSQLLQENYKTSPKPAPVAIKSDHKKKQLTPAALAAHTVGASTKGASFSVKLDSQLLQQSNVKEGKTAKRVQDLSGVIDHTLLAVLASQAAGTGSLSQTGASGSAKFDSQLMQQSNSTLAKKAPKDLSAVIESLHTHGASKQHKAASFSVKLDSQLLQASNATAAKSSPAALAAEGTQTGTRDKRGGTFSVKLDSQL